MVDRGTTMFDAVRAYADLGVHRSGGPADLATATWMADELSARGVAAEIEPVAFDRWVATSNLTVDGEPVDHLAVPNCVVGSLTDVEPVVRSVDVGHGGVPAQLDDIVAADAASGAPAFVYATQHPHGSLVGVNRTTAPPGAVAVVLVAERDLARLQSGTVRLDLDARVEPGFTHNVVAHPDAGADPNPLVLTTPLNGWFRCAGERGTGIAVLLDLVTELADLGPSVVATAGHEFSYFGAAHWMHSTDLEPRAIVHVGASIAVEHDTDHGRELVPTRIAMTSLDDADAAPIAAALSPVGLHLATSVERWRGEGEVLHRMPAPLLSFTGAGVSFHTPDDLPDAATSPDSLRRVADAIATAARALDTHVRQ